MIIDLYKIFLIKIFTHCRQICRKQGGICILIIFLITVAFTQRTYAQVTGPGAAWQYVRKITLNAATPLAYFQVKVSLTTAILGNPYSNIKSDGSDLRFYDINNNSCNYWIEGSFNRTGTSIVWVNIPTTAANVLFMYYGNAAASAVSDGAATFDFFDDFTGTTLGANWQQATTNGTVGVSGGNVTLTCNTTSLTAGSNISSQFAPSSTSFLLETKHQESAYNRNRMYATTGTFGGSPVAVGDYGYFSTSPTTQTSAQVFWGSFPGVTSVSNNTDYLTQWQITDGSTYNWYTKLYSTGAAVTNGSRTTTYGSNIRYISISVTEVASTSTIVDWIRVRKASASFADPTATVGSQLNNLSASTTQTNVFCNGQSTGTATVTAAGGGGGYTYSWNSSPTQATLTATNLSTGIYTVTVNDNQGLTTSATVTIILQPAVTASASNPTNITCNAAADGTITISASGGTGPYSYSVDNVHDINNLIWVTPSPAANPYVYGGLQPGVAYRIRVKDNNGCISK